MDPLVSIGGFAFPEPSTYNATTASLVDSARNVSGYVIGAQIRPDVAKIELTWRYLTASQWASILSLFAGSFYNDVRFLNQTINDYETRTFYVSDRSAGLWRRDPQDGKVLGYTNCALSLIEV